MERDDPDDARLLAFKRIRRIVDPELQIYLAAVFAPIFAMFFMSFEGPVSQNQVLAPFFWFALGIAAYWLPRGRDGRLRGRGSEHRRGAPPRREPRVLTESNPVR